MQQTFWDKLMDWVMPILQKLRLDKLLSRETFSYLFWGVMTTLVNILLFRLLMLFFRYEAANLVAILVAVAFAYVTNKRYVFRTRCESPSALTAEISRYILARSFTMVVEFVGLILLVDLLHMLPMLGKVIVTVVVIILNYFCSKFGVFQKKERAV